MASRSGTCSMISRSHRALTGDDGRIVVPVDVGKPAFGGQRAGMVLGFEKARAVQFDVRAETAAGVALHQRRETRHDHRDRDIEQPPVVRQPERMVARRRRDDAALPLAVVEEQEGVARAAFLERTRALEVFQFAKEPHPGDFRERDRLRAG